MATRRGDSRPLHLTVDKARERANRPRALPASPLDLAFAVRVTALPHPHTHPITAPSLLLPDTSGLRKRNRNRLARWLAEATPRRMRAPPISPAPGAPHERLPFLWAGPWAGPGQAARRGRASEAGAPDT